MSRDKKFQVRVDQDFLDWFDGQIKAHKLDQNRSEIAVEAIRFFFNYRDLIDQQMPPQLIADLDDFISERPRKVKRSLIFTAALAEYLIKNKG